MARRGKWERARSSASASAPRTGDSSLYSNEIIEAMPIVGSKSGGSAAPLRVDLELWPASGDAPSAGGSTHAFALTPFFGADNGVVLRSADRPPRLFRIDVAPSGAMGPTLPLAFESVRACTSAERLLPVATLADRASVPRMKLPLRLGDATAPFWLATDDTRVHLTKTGICVESFHVFVADERGFAGVAELDANGEARAFLVRDNRKGAPYTRVEWTDVTCTLGAATDVPVALAPTLDVQ